VIDTHTHLDALDDPDDVVARARAAGVTRILTVGTDVPGSHRALELADAHDGVYAIVGIHPHAAADATDADIAAVQTLLSHPKAVGAGEMGLDWFRDYALPTAMLQLRQGFGRLIRGHSDRGVVAILDPRLRTKPYGRAFLGALPRCPVAEDPAAVAAFFGSGVAVSA